MQLQEGKQLSYKSGKPSWSQEVIDTVRQLRQNGMKVKDISAVTGMPMGTIGTFVTPRYKKSSYEVEVPTDKNVNRRAEYNAKPKIEGQYNSVNRVYTLYCEGYDTLAISKCVKIPKIVVVRLIEDAKALGRLTEHTSWTFNQSI